MGNISTNYVDGLELRNRELSQLNLKLYNTNLQLKAHIKDLKESLHVLQENSEGVAGLHLNGDVAPWDELREGGRFEEWLMVFDEELEADLW